MRRRRTRPKNAELVELARIQDRMDELREAWYAAQNERREPAPGNTRACVWGIHAPDAETAIRLADELVGRSLAIRSRHVHGAGDPVIGVDDGLGPRGDSGVPRSVGVRPRHTMASLRSARGSDGFRTNRPTRGSMNAGARNQTWRDQNEHNPNSVQAMIRPLELAIGLRYLRGTQRTGFISFISLISVLGIALGITALITVLSVMNGFERELRSRILGMASHATIAGFRGPLKDWQGAADRVLDNPSVLAAAPYVEGQAMLTAGGAVRGVLVRGVEPDEERLVSDVSQYMVTGGLDELEAGAFRILVGSTLATRLGLELGSRVTAIAPEAIPTPAGVVPRHRRFEVAGIFEAGHGQYDSSFVFVHMEDAGKLFRVRDGVSGLRLRLTDVFAAPRLAREIAESLGGRYWVTDWTRYHAQFFRALRIEKTAMFIILTLIVTVAAFNLVSTLVMVVNEKQPEIAILRTLGLARASVLAVFLVQGTLIGLVGTAVGAATGVALAGNLAVVVPAIERLIGQKFLSPEIYYLADVPADIRATDVMAIIVIAFVMSMLATIYPAWRGANTQPTETLRHE